MTEYEKMRAGLLYKCGDREIVARLLRAAALCCRLRTENRESRQVLEELLPDLPASVRIDPPFFCDLGCGIHVGEAVHIAASCCILDTGSVFIGEGSRIGSGALLCTPHHPLQADVRRTNAQYGFDIHIGAHCVLGARVIVCPGVRIGEGTIVAAGSVVTKDLPAHVLAAGIPASVIRSLVPSDGHDAADKAEPVPSPCPDQERAQSLSARLLQAAQDENQALQKALWQELVLDRGEAAEVCLPFFCLTGSNIHLGPHSFINYNATILDQAPVHIGDHTLIGPNCLITTIQDPDNNEASRNCPPDRHNEAQAAAVHIGADCWLGGGVTVCPGVRIGDRSIVAAGSVVTHDLPPDCLAAGNPAQIKRRLQPADTANKRQEFAAQGADASGDGKQ